MGTVRTTCPYCGVGCGILASADGTIQGDPDHPANQGRLCSKGSALGETLDLEGRLLAPQILGRHASWEDALDLVAGEFQAALDEHGPDSVAFYVSGQLLTEDYYVANKLMKGFMGSANIDTNSRLCMASSVAGHKRAFGTDTVPGTYEDLEEADLVVLVGSNLAWCHPVLYQRIATAKAARPSMRIVVVDPRKTATIDLADLHLAISPGGDVALFNAVLSKIVEMDRLDTDFAHNVDGLDQAIEAARRDDPAKSGLAPEDLDHFCDLFVKTQKVVTVYSQGVNQAVDGSDKVNAIINCHLATGRIGRPGMGPFSVTGQPNAMGGREVGGLANMLACHLDLENTTHRDAVQGFWNAPFIPEAAGLKAVDLFEAVKTGQIKALWIMSTNPAVSMPDAGRVRHAIKACPFVVVSDIMARTDTGDLADVLLPASGWGEKNGTVTNSERTISRQRAFLDPPKEARPDWQIICDVAARMGWAEAFDYKSPAEIFREYARLSAVSKKLGKDFDISAASDLSDQDYDDWAPQDWPLGGPKRFFANGRFFTKDRRARAVPVRSGPAAPIDLDHPFRLNTGRVRDHWHTMTRTGKAPRLGGHMGEPFLEIHPEDAQRCQIEPAHLVEVTSPHGRAVLRALVTDRVSRGSVFAPIHWTAQVSSNGRVDDVIAALCDPVSGQPALKSTFVNVTKFAVDWYGFAVSRSCISARSDYWAVARRDGGHSVELGGVGVEDWVEFAQVIFGPSVGYPSAQLVTGTADARLMFTKGGVLEAALFVSKSPVEVARNFVVSQLGQPTDAAFLAGRPPQGIIDPGATVCSCFGVGVNSILSAIAKDGLRDVDAIGRVLQAGTNCGSCRPELKTLLGDVRLKVAAQ